MSAVCSSEEEAMAGAIEDLMDVEEAAKWAVSFNEYTEARKTNGNAIADMALENFEEVLMKSCLFILQDLIPSTAYLCFFR